MQNHASPTGADNRPFNDLLRILQDSEQDLKIELETLTRGQAMNIARFLANVVGKAHARQMDADTRSKWAKELSRARSGDLKAPSWLWTSVVDLLALHERAYLEHCRLYALNESH